MPFETYIALGGYFLAMLAIGVFAYRASTDDLSGYILGGRRVSPQVTALSAGASDMSGWMLMGLPGAMFVMGYDTVWIALGLWVGAFFNYLWVAPRLRVFTEMADDALTLPDFFDKRFHLDNSSIRLMTASVIILFFTLYTSAGLVAGGKLFESAFGLDYAVGIYITASVVVVYTLLGGFLAVSLTDFVQGCIMFVALILVPVVAMNQFDSSADWLSHANTTIGGVSSMLEGLTMMGVVSSLAWGLGYFGQPHIIVRFMAIRSVQDIPVARRIGMSWMTITLIGAMMTGLVGVAYVNKFQLTLSDPETIFIVFSDILFHPFIGGFLLAAILAAIMSTISSQLLVSSSSLTEDIYRAFFRKTASQPTLVRVGRLGVLVVAALAALLSLNPKSSILSLVSNAWAGFGAAFGPLVLFSLFWSRMTPIGAAAGIISGTITVLFWSFAPILADGKTLSTLLYEMVPGFMVSSLAIVVVSRLGEAPSHAILARFQQMQLLLKSEPSSEASLGGITRRDHDK